MWARLEGAAAGCQGHRPQGQLTWEAGRAGIADRLATRLFGRLSVWRAAKAVTSTDGSHLQPDWALSDTSCVVRTTAVTALTRRSRVRQAMDTGAPLWPWRGSGEAWRRVLVTY